MKKRTSASKQLTFHQELEKIYEAGLRAHGIPTKDPLSQKLLKKNISARLKSLQKENGGILLLKRDKRRNLVAVLLVTSGGWLQEFEPVTSRWQFQLMTFPGDPQAHPWALQQLKGLQSLFNDSAVNGHLEFWQSGLLKKLPQMGLYPTSLALDGRVENAVRKLAETYGHELSALPPDLSIVPIKTPSALNTYISIIKREFQKNPHFGTFVSSPGFLKMLRKEMSTNLGKKHTQCWLIKKNGRALGGFDYHPSRKKTFGGELSASMGLNFGSALQGRGLAKWAYWTMLQEMKSRKISRFTGSTAQPGVMHLGLIMERHFHAVQLQKLSRPLFSSNYFDPWIKRFSKVSI